MVKSRALPPSTMMVDRLLIALLVSKTLASPAMAEPATKLAATPIRPAANDRFISGNPLEKFHKNTQLKPVMFGRAVLLFTLRGLCDSLVALERRFDETNQALGGNCHRLFPEILSADREGF